MNYKKERANINTIINDIDNIIKLSVDRKIRIEYNLQQELPDTYLDSTQIKQVIVNLVQNASDAIQGKGTIEISTSLRDKSLVGGNPIITESKDISKCVSLRISDNGLGIPDEHLNKLFDPFYTTKSEGKGLGLSVVLGIIKNHNAEICFRTDLEKGTTFEVLIPVIQTANQ